MAQNGLIYDLLKSIDNSLKLLLQERRGSKYLLRMCFMQIAETRQICH